MSSLYKTKPGDSIEKIIEKYNFSYKDFEKLNKVEDLKLMKGQMVLIPLPLDKHIKLHQHTTESEETLKDIRSKYNIPYDEIKYFNNFSHLFLEEGQIVKIEPKLISPVLDGFQQNS